MRRSLVSLLLFFLLAGGSALMAQSRRALLIGIDTYSLPGGAGHKAIHAESQQAVVSEKSRWDLPTWPDLEGAVNDAEAMKVLLTSAKFGFPKTAPYMHMLTNRQATRKAILEAMQKYLVDEPAKGDIVVFYYAGHGSQRLNSKTSKPLHRDETIVPSNANTGEFDVRDKEIARILNKALDKGVKLTAIFDSCHSGSIARGIPMGSGGAVRFLGYDPRDANDPDDKIDRPEDRKDNSALVFTATQHDQFAREWEMNGEHHGAFTIALIEALRELPANTPANDVYKRVRVVMQGMGLGDQQPTLGGMVSRPQDTLFGSPGGATRMRIAVGADGVLDNGRVQLDGGTISGIGPGSELVKVEDATGGSVTRIRIVELHGLDQSYAEIVGQPPAKKIETGDLFELDKWVPAEQNRLQVWMAPASLTAADLEDFADEMSELRKSPKLTWVDDPATVASTHLLSWNGDEWTLTATGGVSQSLGRKPTARQVLEKISGSNGTVRLLVDFPPAKELAAAMKLGEGSSAAVDLLKRPPRADYLLVGRLGTSGVEYSWVLKDVIANGSTASSPKSVCGATTSFPLRSDWIPMSKAAADTTARNLADYAANLAKVKLWLGMKAPPAGADSDFPYTLALKHTGAGADYVDNGKVTEGEAYDLVLRAPGKLPPVIERRWIYVLGIDCTGAGKLLYPLGSTAEGNHQPEQGTAPAEISLTGGGRPITIVPPFGMDTYILLTTSTQLPDPSVLHFDAVMKTRGAGPRSPLADLLGSASAGVSRGTAVLPTDWTIQQLQTLSVPK